jgi:hypothetical protein
LQAILRKGLRPVEIARQYQVNQGMVSKAIRKLSYLELFDVVRLGQWKPASFEIAPVPLDAPVDVIGVLNSVLSDAMAMRVYLETDEGRTLAARMRFQTLDKSMAARLNWADSFVRNRAKLLELISVDQWLNEMLAIIEQEGPGLKERVVERVRQRLLGFHQPLVPATIASSTSHPNAVGDRE